MPLAVIADVHANLQAFHAVLADIDAGPAREIVCLGDLVGYGGDPEACVELLRSRDIPCVLGNHESGLSDPQGLEWFNPMARVALRRTRALLSDHSLAFLSQLPRSLVVHGARCVHGVPPADPNTYLFELRGTNLDRLLETMPEPLAFVGHTHEPLLASRPRGPKAPPAEVGPLPEGLTVLEPGRNHVVNVGSVGQPRDGDPRAAWVLWDQAAGTVELRRVKYDVKAAADRIIARGFEKRYAERLYG